MDYFICIIRQPNGLMARFSRQRQSFATNEILELCESGFADEKSLYEIVDVPLDTVAKSLVPNRDQILSAWNGLESVLITNVLTQKQALTVIRETIAASDASLRLLPLSEADLVPIVPIKPTAAHPRAYQGTTVKPPKPKSPARIDLRPYLCDTASVNFLLQKWQVSDDLAASDTRLPWRFRSTILPLIKHLPLAEINGYLTLYWALKLEENAELLAAVVRLIYLQNNRQRLQWCEFAGHYPEDWWLTYVTLVIESEAYRQDFTAFSESDREAFVEVIQHPQPVYRLWSLLWGLYSGATIEYMMAGFHLANRFQVNKDFDTIVGGRTYPEDYAEALVKHLQKGCQTLDRFQLTVWENCGQLDGFSEVIETVAWENYSPDLAYRYYEFYRGRYWDDLPEDKLALKWSAVRQQVPTIETLFYRTSPDYQLKWISQLDRFIYDSNSSQDLQEKLPFVYQLLERVCQFPFDSDCDTTPVTIDFIAYLNDRQRQRFLAAPNTNFYRLEEACQTNNNATLIGYGTYRLVKQAPEFSLVSFLEHPKKLCKVSKMLGCLRRGQRDQVIREFLALPIMSPDFETMSLPEICDAIEAIGEPNLLSVVSRKLKDHLSGLRVLDKVKLQHYETEMRKKLTLERLEALERIVMATLAGDFPVDTQKEAVRHALQMRAYITDNRKPLSKFLKAYWNGDEDYLMSHPLTQDWIKKHPKLKLETWLNGVIYEDDDMRISIEQDPLEALKLGTYVGSCLSLGGSFAYSAAAAVLDINKQVLYARDKSGTVIARQLIAISDEDEMVCFYVYPIGVSKEIERKFAEYDTKFAAALGLSLHKPDDDSEDYTISKILSHDWYDDCAWRFSEPRKRKTNLSA